MPSPFGNAPNSWPIEWMPPVEAPIATMRARSRDGLRSVAVVAEPSAATALRSGRRPSARILASSLSL